MRELPLGGNHNYLKLLIAAFLITLAFTEYSETPAALGAAGQTTSPRTRLLINDDWRFTRGDPSNITTSLLYDIRPAPASRSAEPAVSPSASADVVKSWILPAGNNFLKDPNWQSASSRWYPGGGIYRNVWLVKTAPVHVGQWGTQLTTPEISQTSARVDLKIAVDNDSKQDERASVATQIFEIDREDRKVGAAVASIPPAIMQIAAGKNAAIETKGTIANPKLWGTGLHQKPNRYVAVTTVQQNGKTVDVYETPFGVRTLKFDPNAGFFLNGEHIKLNGVCDHHDLGALGAAVNYRALQRQLEMLADMGANAIRTSHNPPAPELLDLADKMGFLIMDEAFDVWAQQKTVLGYNLLFTDWHEQDLRALLRRDRNHPSVIMWSIGNEVGEQTEGEKGAAVAAELTRICHEEDPTRPTISGMNSASPTSPFTAAVDAVGLNYQGVGIYGRPPQYPAFHQSFPDKFIVGAETTSTISSRGVYTFPVASGLGTPATAKAGQDTENRQISSYDLYFANWSYSPDKEFAAQDRYPFLGGEFVWTGWDYLGEPTPLALAIVRSKRGQKGSIIVAAKSDGLEETRITVVAK
jgi:beta-galactosidase